jgi:hypothetical protein
MEVAQYMKCTVMAVSILTYGCKPELSKHWIDKIEATKMSENGKRGGGGTKVRMVSTYGLKRMKGGRLSCRFCNANHQKERSRQT